MKRFFGYIRVSTAKQGEGVSLQQQRDAIDAYARRFGVSVTQWFEEKVTAAKRGRPVFSEMIALLSHGKADGVILHKIDRGARNLRDWADLGELIDRGIDVQFANESLDLHSRGGRLSADIQAVVAADYIRNLREETLKGFYGRLKQGLTPLPAPLGYVNQGQGKPKAIHARTGPLVRKAFELYATGQYTLITLGEKMEELGLRNSIGNRVSRNSWSVILNNPFYIGLIRIRSTGQTFPGVHPPLIHKSLFDRVQRILKGKAQVAIRDHDFLFRRLLTCATCGRALIGEQQKGHTYYRCHSPQCRGVCVREERVKETIDRLFAHLQFTDEEQSYLQTQIAVLRKNWIDDREIQRSALESNKQRLKSRLLRLTDAYLDGVLERRLFEDRKTALLHEEKALDERQSELGRESGPDRLGNFFELAKSVYFTYKTGLADEKRELLEIVTSNCRIEQKNVLVELKSPFQLVADRAKNPSGGPCQDTVRTRVLNRLLQNLLRYFNTNTGYFKDRPTTSPTQTAS